MRVLLDMKEETTVASDSVLIAFFSHSGNTQVVAKEIHEAVGGDIFRIVAVHPYPCDYNEVVEMARGEQQAKDRPALTAEVTNMDSYHVIFVDYPNWWSTMPMAVFSFIESHDLAGKKIVPFCTHEGSSMGRSVTDIRQLCPKSIVLDGLAVRGGNVRTARKDVRAWLERIGLLGNVDTRSR